MSNIIKNKPKSDSQEKMISIRMIKPKQVENVLENNDDSLPHVYENQIQRAQEEAHNILENAKKQVELFQKQLEKQKQAIEEEKVQIYEMAKAEGYKAGVQLGQEQAYQELNEHILSAKSIIEDARKEYVQLVEQSEKTILEIGLKTAEKILNCTLADHPEKFIDLVKKAITETMDHKEVKIFVHPNQYSVVVNKKEEFLTSFFTELQVYIYPDSTINDGGCIIETDGETVDASIDSQLHEIREKLFEFFNGDRHESN